MCRDEKNLNLPRRSITNTGIIKAKEKDETIEKERTDKINESKYKKQDRIFIGNAVFLRNIQNIGNLSIHCFYHNHVLLSILTKIR